jgi:hypothetical protein
MFMQTIGKTLRSRFVVYFCLLIFFLPLWFCTPQTPTLPYEEKLVIRGLLEAGQLVSDIQISKTIPPLEEFTYEKVFVGDAQATIIVDGQSYPMQLQPRTSTAATVPYRSLYRVPNLRVMEGKTYSIEVRWKTLVARAEARVPFAALVDSVSILTSIVPVRTTLGTVVLDTVFESRAVIRARSNELYRTGTNLHDPQTSRLLSSRGFGEATLTESSRIIAVTSNTWRSNNVALPLLNARTQSRVIVETYDGAFYRYYQTRARSGQVGLFSPGGPNIEWNVTGDGLGEFAGVSIVQRVAVPRLRN